MLDPDRFFQLRTPGSQEWWYFDAISDDGRDILVLVWYAGLPFDPDYGVAALKHLDEPERHPVPDPLDHCAVGVSWYRDGKTQAYALNSFRRGDFRFSASPPGVEIAGNRWSRDERGYHLEVQTPDVSGKKMIRASIRFDPARDTQSWENDLGGADSPHFWIVAAADCRVAGDVEIGGQALSFAGRGYHDHNAGSEEISRAMRRWEWGRCHHGPMTAIYYQAEPHSGPVQTVSIRCREGRPESVETSARFIPGVPNRNIFGVRGSKDLTIETAAHSLHSRVGRCLDDGPFYRRWGATFSGSGMGEDFQDIPGISELLATKNLNRRLYNWMIPYRLKRPGTKLS